MSPIVLENTFMASNVVPKRSDVIFGIWAKLIENLQQNSFGAKVFTTYLALKFLEARMSHYMVLNTLIG